MIQTPNVEVIQEETLSDYHDRVAPHHAPGTPINLRLQRDRKAHAQNNQGKFTAEDVAISAKRFDGVKDDMKKIMKKSSESSNQNDSGGDSDNFEVLLDDFDE